MALFREVVFGDSVGTRRDAAKDARKKIQQAYADSLGSRPLDTLGDLQDHLVSQVEEVVRKSRTMDRLIIATRAALDGPRTGLGTSLNRISIFLEKLSAK